VESLSEPVQDGVVLDNSEKELLPGSLKGQEKRTYYQNQMRARPWQGRRDP
jgi:hypothetical protein